MHRVWEHGIEMELCRKNTQNCQVKTFDRAKAYARDAELFDIGLDAIR